MLLLYAASGRDNFLTCRCTHLDTTKSHSAGRFTIGQQLCRSLPLADDSGILQRFLGDFRSFRQAIEIAEPDNLMLDAKDIRETTLGQTTRERHLATFELWLAATRSVVTRAGLDSLVSLTGSLSGSGSWTTAKTLAIPVRARCRREVVQSDLF
jgi:hypothetical protein